MAALDGGDGIELHAREAPHTFGHVVVARAAESRRETLPCNDVAAERGERKGWHNPQSFDDSGRARKSEPAPRQPRHAADPKATDQRLELHQSAQP
jgi:hypothetical protein